MIFINFEALPKIDDEFQKMIPQLSEKEFEQLEQCILQDKKCRDAILIWNGIIIDGYNRFLICIKHGIEFQVKEMIFADRNEVKLWLLNNQLGRRNLDDAERIELALLNADIFREKERQIESVGDEQDDLANIGQEDLVPACGSSGQEEQSSGIWGMRIWFLRAGVWDKGILNSKIQSNQDI